MLLSHHGLKVAKILPSEVSSLPRYYGDYMDILVTIKGSGPITYNWTYTSSYGNFSSGLVVAPSNVLLIQNQYRSFGSYVYAAHTLVITNIYGSNTYFYNIYS